MPNNQKEIKTEESNNKKILQKSKRKRGKTDGKLEDNR
jgi:hypothetical protein